MVAQRWWLMIRLVSDHILYIADFVQVYAGYISKTSTMWTLNTEKFVSSRNKFCKSYASFSICTDTKVILWKKNLHFWTSVSKLFFTYLNLFFYPLYDAIKKKVWLCEENINDLENSEKMTFEKNVLISYWSFDTIHIGRKIFFTLSEIFIIFKNI